MHEEIFSEKQLAILPFLKGFSKKFGLVGGTAIALHLGHRRSIDYDLFSLEEFNSARIGTMLKKRFNIQKTIVDKDYELTLYVDDVKLTFYYFPYDIAFTEKVKTILKMPDLLTLAAMKAFALGRRAKWKDYVDLYFIFQKYSLSEVTSKAEELFQGEFNERLFREQLSYHQGIDYSEEVEYMPGFEMDEKTVKDTLTEISLEK